MPKEPERISRGEARRRVHITNWVHFQKLYGCLFDYHPDDIREYLSHLAEAERDDGVPPVEAWCECEHAAHFDAEMVQHGEAHRYGALIEDRPTRAVTTWGVFRVCKRCEREHLEGYMK